MMFMEVITIEHKNDAKQIITLWWGGDADSVHS